MHLFPLCITLALFLACASPKTQYTRDQQVALLRYYSCLCDNIPAIADEFKIGDPRKDIALVANEKCDESYQGMLDSFINKMPEEERYAALVDGLSDENKIGSCEFLVDAYITGGQDALDRVRLKAARAFSTP